MKPVVSLASRVRVPDGIVSQNLQDELVLLNLNTGVYFGLNPVGTRVWHLIQAHRNTTLQHILDSVVEECDVGPDQGARDLLHLVERLAENRLIELDR